MLVARVPSRSMSKVVQIQFYELGQLWVIHVLYIKQHRIISSFHLLQVGVFHPDSVFQVFFV